MENVPAWKCRTEIKRGNTIKQTLMDREWDLRQMKLAFRNDEICTINPSFQLPPSLLQVREEDLRTVSVCTTQA